MSRCGIAAKVRKLLWVGKPKQPRISPINGYAQIALDFLVSAILIRVAIGTVLAHPGILRFIGFCVAFGLVFFLVQRFDLFLATLVLAFLAIPMGLMLLVNLVPELRRLYQAVMAGQTIFDPVQTADAVPELAKGLVEMARKRVGAILVFAQRDDIDQHLSGGETVECDINKSILLSIFNPGAPRHDGAVLIDRGRISRIGSVLPLASADRADERWGTRHLAAAGLCENCDAKVIVVSEERGVISAGEHGELTPINPVTEENVEQVVRRALGLDVDSTRKEARARRNNWLWAISAVLALGGAILASQLAHWVRSEAVVRTFVASVRLDNIPDQLSIDGEVSNVDVLTRIPGTTGVFVGADPNLALRVDLSDYTPGLTQINLTSEMVTNMPENWEVERFTPQVLEFNLVRTRLLEIPIEPVIGEPPPGFEVGAVSLTPGQIRAAVRDAARKPSDRLPIRPIDLKQINAPGTYKFEVPVPLPPTITAVGQTDKPTVTVTVVIEKAELKPEGEEVQGDGTPSLPNKTELPGPLDAENDSEDPAENPLRP